MRETVTLLLGAHLSISGGITRVYQEAEKLQINCVQIFTKSGRQWNAKPLTQSEIKEFLKERERTKIIITAAHAGYLINIGAHDEAIAIKSIDSLKLELERAQQLCIPYLVLHPGTALNDQDSAACLARISQRLDIVLKKITGSTMILLETAAGQGKNVGYTFEQLQTIYKNVQNRDRIGFCFDTCHAFAAGYDFTTNESYISLWKSFDEILGLENLKLIHLNDSQKGIGSRIDRHAPIGEGALGLNPFKLIMNDAKLKYIAKIIETPKKSDSDDQKNLDRLRSLLRK